MNIYEIVLRTIMILVFSYTFFRFGQRYLVQLTNFMFNTPTTWNKHIDKPRFYMYAVGFLFMLIASILFKSSKPIFSIPIEVPKILFFIVFLMGGFICHFTWTKKFKTTFIPKVQHNLNPLSIISETRYSNDEINQIFERAISKGLCKGDLKSFEHLVHNKEVEPDKRIQWLDTSPKNAKILNTQTLLEFLSNLIPELESSTNKNIISFCNKYFCDSEMKTIKISSKTVTKWKKNKSDYLKDLSDIIKG